jgi:hypothetical protein
VKGLDDGWIIFFLSVSCLKTSQAKGRSSNIGRGRKRTSKQAFSFRLTLTETRGTLSTGWICPSSYFLMHSRKTMYPF